jgi:hypothetical protein
MATGESSGLSPAANHLNDGRRHYPPYRTRSANAHPDRGPALFEIALGITGTGLAIFMTGHLTLLFTVLIGADTMNGLAAFLEDNYLLWMGVPPVIVLFAIHVVMAVRKSRRRSGSSTS